MILGPDGPTAGGFVVAATVVHADFWKIGQFRPVGDTVRFREVTIDEAIALEPCPGRDPDDREPGADLVAETIKSSLPGTFYRRPNPQSDPYVSEGDTVKEGDVVGLVEIMKSFHEVVSDAAGVIARFLVENEELVDAGQDIIALEPV